jgi:hypothetical protein
LSSVQFFQFQTYKTELVGFFKNFNRFFSRLGFFGFFAHPDSYIHILIC